MPITINGSTGIAGVDGSAGTPALRGTDGDSGVYFTGSQVGFSTNGAGTTLTLDSSGNVTFPGTVAMSSPYAMRNKIINGHFLWDQRGGGTVWAGGVANTQTYTLDRWYYVQTLASKFSMQRQLTGGPAGLPSYVNITSSAATTPSASAIYVYAQKIEAANLYDTSWGTASAKTVTLSFWVRSSLTGTFGGALFNGNADRNYVFSYTINSANTWEYKTITIAGPTSGTWSLTGSGTGLQIYFDMGSGPSSKGTAGSWGNTNFYGVTGGTNVIGTSGATLDLTGVQFELGSTATPFELTDVGVQFAQIQRYYQIQNNTEYHVCPAPGATYASTYPVHFPVVMRGTPTLGFSYSMTNAISTYTSAVYSGPRGFVHYISASVSTNAYMAFTYTAESEL